MEKRKSIMKKKTILISILLGLYVLVTVNIAQAMENKGTIWISTYREKGGNVNISIKDSGSGIPPENLEKIFQSFFGTKAKGFGYGLTICRMIMGKHGGSIYAQSEDGEGATFILSFPFANTGN